MKKYLIYSLMGLGVLALSTTAVLAAGKNDSGQLKRIGQGWHLGWLGGNGFEQKAQLLGITAEELKTQIKSGKTFAQIAAENGLTEEQFRAKMLESMKQRLDQLVSEGRITQEEADRKLQLMQERQKNCPGFGAMKNFKEKRIKNIQTGGI